MATTKKSLAEQALRIIQGGDISDDSSIDIREIMLFIEQERDMLMKQTFMEYKKIGEHEITGDFLSTYNLSSENNQVILYHHPVNLPNGAGVFSVKSGQDFYIRMPSSNGMYNKAISKTPRKGYNLIGDTLTFTPTISDGVNFTVQLVVSSKSLGETDAFPIPADFESTIIRRAVELYTVMEAAVEDNQNDREENQ